MNLDQAEQWANLPLDMARDILLHPGGYSRALVALAADLIVADYDHRGQELERLTAIITRYETGAQTIIHKINQGVNR